MSGKRIIEGLEQAAAAEIARMQAEEVARLREAAQAVVDRWHTPLWKDAEPTAAVIGRLSQALAAEAGDRGEEA